MVRCNLDTHQTVLAYTQNKEDCHTQVRSLYYSDMTQ